MLYDTVENLINIYDQSNDYADLTLELFKVLSIENPLTEEEFRNMEKEDKFEKVRAAAVEALDRKNQRICEVAMPVITNLIENSDYRGKIIVPITDGKRVFNLRVDLQEAYDTQCKSIIKEWQKGLLLVTIDELWKEHLRELDQLRQSVQNASYEQKDPLVIYKVESFHLFENMLNQLNVKALSALMRAQIPVRQQAPDEQGQQPERRPDVKEAAPDMPDRYKQNNYRTSREALPGENAQRQAASAHQGERQPVMPAKAAPKIGRNDPCPCGSGKKYKNCHGKGL